MPIIECGAIGYTTRDLADASPELARSMRNTR
jgi:hypothetical protein